MIAVEVRACIAGVAIAHATQQPVTAIYDHKQGVHHDISATFKGDTLLGYDVQRASKLTGTLPDIYDSDRSGYFSLTKNGQYSGYDHPSKTHFNIVVTGNSASFYDHDAKIWQQYSLA